MKVVRFVSSLVLACGFLAIGHASAAAAPGDLDRFFGGEGVASLEDVPGASVSAVDMAIGPDDKIYALRSRAICFAVDCPTDFLVSRRTPNGAPDTSFGSSGTSSLFGSLGKQRVGFEGSLAVGADGRAVVAATTSGGNLVLARLNSDGSVDGTFGMGGIAEVALGAASGVEIAIQDDGKVVVGAVLGSGYGGTRVVVTRLSAQGTTDSAFNGGQPAVTNFSRGLGGLDLTAGSRVVIAGMRCCEPASSAIHVARLNAGGVFDRRFGRHGHRFIDDVAHAPQVDAVLALPGGKVVVVGTGNHGVTFALRLLPNGRPDRGFSGDGVAYTKDTGLGVAGAAVDRRGRLVIGGVTASASSFGGAEIAVLRRLENGRPDRTFAGGSLAHLYFAQETRVDTIGLQSGGKIVALAAVGSCARTCTPPESKLVRFLGGSSGVRCRGRKATIVGTRTGERITGTRRRDVIAVLSGDDLVRGRGGNDLICGGRGNDRLVGGKGRDRLVGGPGRDRIRQR